MNSHEDSINTRPGGQRYDRNNRSFRQSVSTRAKGHQRQPLAQIYGQRWRVLTSLSSSAVLGEQIYGPYGTQRYSQGTMGTDKGYTGQFQDAVSGFDYYNARYYDPVMGQFLSADSVQGNAQGMDPYSYVNGNPETATDPTGQRISCPPDCGTTTGSSGGSTPCTLGHAGCGSPALTSCDSGFHLTNGSCEQNQKKSSSGSSGSHCGCDGATVPQKNQCGSGMLPRNNGSCAYTSGPCANMSVEGCNDYKQKEKEVTQKEQEAADHFHQDWLNYLTQPWWSALLGAFAGYTWAASDAASIAEIYEQAFSALAQGKGDLEADLNGISDTPLKAEALSFQIIARDIGVAIAAAIIGAVTEAAGVVLDSVHLVSKETFDNVLGFLGPITPTAAVLGAIWVAIDATSLEWQYADYISQIRQIKSDEEQDGYI